MTIEDQVIIKQCNFCDDHLFAMQYGEHDFCDLEREFFAGVRSIGRLDEELALAYVRRYKILTRTLGVEE